MDDKGNSTGLNNIYSEMSELNDTTCVVKSLINRINTAIPVKVIDVYPPRGSENPTGYVDVLPLITFTDSNGEVVNPTNLYHLPYFRLQGGVVAIVTDPIVGDIGLAIFAQKDSTTVVVGTKEPVQPGSFRRYSMSDGWYIGGFLNQKPTCYLELNQDDTATLNAVNGTVINVNTGGLTINGNVQINGKLDVTGQVTGGNGSVTLVNHIHVGVHGNTTPPVSGT